jgi:hypothetical protein
VRFSEGPPSVTDGSRRRHRVLISSTRRGVVGPVQRVTCFTSCAAVSALAANAATDNRHHEAWQVVGGSPFS